MKLNKFVSPFPVSFVLISIPCANNGTIGECVSGLYNWSLAIVGIIAFVQIIYAGWIYLTAAGNTTKTGEAMSKISNAVLGIVLLFSSYLILNTINPDLVGGGIALPNLKGDKVEDVNYNEGNTTSSTNVSGSTTTLSSGSTTTVRSGATTTTIAPNTPLIASPRDQEGQNVLDHIGPNTDAEICLTGSGFAPVMGLYLAGFGIFSITVHTPSSATLHLNASDPQWYYGWQDIQKSKVEVGYYIRNERSSEYMSVYYDLEGGVGTVRPSKPCSN